MKKIQRDVQLEFIFNDENFMSEMMRKTRYIRTQLRLIAYFEMHYVVNVYLVNAPMKIGYLFCRWSQWNSLMFFKLFRLTTNPVALLQSGGGGGAGDPKEVKRLNDMDSTEHNNLSI